MAKVRRILGIGAAIPILLLAVPTATAGASAEPHMMSGVVRAANGAPAVGRVLLFHDDLDENNRLLLMSSTMTGADGRYNVHLRPNAAIAAAGAANNGYADFVAYAVTDEGVSDYRFFSAQLGRASWRGSRTTNLDEVDLTATRALPSADFPAQVGNSIREAQALRSRARRPNTTPDQWLSQCYYEVYQVIQRQTPVVELHNRYADLSARVEYGERIGADSDITVGVRAEIESFGFNASGTNHVGHSRAVTAGITKFGSYGKVLRTLFDYNRWRHQPDQGVVCTSPPAPYEIIKAKQWTGNTFEIAWDDGRFDGQCLSTYYQYRDSLMPGEDWYREDEQLTGYSWTMNVSSGITAGMSAWSGASARVTIAYDAGNATGTRWICGNNANPGLALRVFAGH